MNATMHFCNAMCPNFANSGIDQLRADLAAMTARAEQAALNEVIEQALEALEDSVDLVQREFDTDWRQGIPTRKAQLAYMEEMLQKHKDSITALRGLLEGEK